MMIVAIYFLLLQLNIKEHQQSSRYTTAEADKLAKDFIQVLATVAHIQREMDTCRTVFQALGKCD